MKKKAGLLESLLPAIKQKLTSPEVRKIVSEKPLMFPSIQDANLSSVMSVLNKSKVKSVTAPPPESKPEARAYVTTGDVDNDGYIDTINIVSPKLEHLDKFHTLNGEALAHFLNSFAEIILHEGQGHLLGGRVKYDPTKPLGGIGSESAAQAVVPKPVLANKRNIEMNKKTKAISILTKLANQLDNKDILNPILSMAKNLSQASDEPKVSLASSKDQKISKKSSEKIKKVKSKPAAESIEKVATTQVKQPEQVEGKAENKIDILKEVYGQVILSDKKTPFGRG